MSDIFKNTTGGEFSNAANWSTHAVPTDDDVSLAKGSYTVTLDGGASVEESSLIIGKGATLDVTDDMVAGGAADLTIDDDTLLNTGSVLEATAGGDITLDDVLGSGSVIVDGAGSLIDVTGSATSGSFTISDGGTLEFDGGVGENPGAGPVVNSPVINFGPGAGNVLDLVGEGRGASGEIGRFFGQISGFSSGDSIDVRGAGAGDHLATPVSIGGGQTIVAVENAAGKVIEDLTFDNLTKPLHLTQTTYNGLVDQITVEGDLGCFLAGTMVSTPSGQVAVETLKHGDIVLSSDGREVPVIWVGKQTVSTRFADPLRVLPIRIKAGAIDENVPARDLLVSPDHAMLVQGALVHAGAMVNGASIVRETRVPETFVYYHVEAEDHSIILAENAPAETFIDNIDRLGFDNWAEHQALYPEGRTVEELPYPRAKSARQIPVHVRVKLAERSQAIGADVSAVA